MTLGTPCLRGEVALLTDGLSESGKAMALGLASLGVDIAFVHAPEDCEAAREVGELVLASGRRALLLAADSAPEEALALAIERTRELLGGVDLVIDNGGLGGSDPSGARVEIRGL